eukprot:g2108.t2
MPHTPRGRRSIGDADEPRGDEPRCLGITGLAEFSFFRRLSRRSAAAVSPAATPTPLRSASTRLEMGSAPGTSHLRALFERKVAASADR